MANENMIQFLRGNVANLPETATAGALYFTKDEGIYLGLEDGSYHRYGDFITVDSVEDIPAKGARANCMYYCVAENILARYDAENSKWVQVNKQPTAEELYAALGIASLATKAELNDVDAKFASYNTTAAQKVIDDAQDAEIAKKVDSEAYEADKATFAIAETVNAALDLKANANEVVANTTFESFKETNSQAIADVDAKFADYTKTVDLPTDLGDFTNNAGYAKTTDVNVELAKKVDNTTYAEDKATFALKTDLNAYRTSAAQDEIDADFEERIADLEAIDHDQLAKDASAAAVATVLDGAPEKFDTLKEIAAWIAEADTAEDAASLVTRVSALEAIDHDAYVDADAELKEELEGKINAINNHSHSFVESELNKIADGDVAKWNNEIGAKALAETKLDAATFNTYSEAHANDYTNTQIDDAISEAAAEAQAAAEETAAEALADARTEVTDEIAEAVAGVNAVVDTKANDADVYKKTETYTKEEVAAAIAAAVEAAHTWGEF